MTYQTTRLYDANGPYTFLSVSGSTVQRLHIAFLMLDRPVCPTDGTNVRYNGVVRLRGDASTPGFTAPTDGSYCLVEMATCSSNGVVFCA